MSEHISEPAPRPSRRSALVLWTVSAVGIFLSAFIVLVLQHFFGDMNPQLLQLEHALICYLPFLALPVCLLMRRTPGLWQRLRPYSVSFPQAIGLRAEESAMVVPMNRAELSICILYMAVFPGICEELLFRGVMLPAFERNGTRHAILVSGALFALLHGSLQGLPVHFMMGLLLGALVVWSNSIYAGFIFHTTYNATTAILGFLANRAVDDVAMESDSLLEIAGGLPGVEVLLIGAMILGAILLGGLRLYQNACRRRGYEIEPRRPEPLRGGEWPPLIIGLVLVCIRYALNLLV